jgi:Phage tail lysozyme
VRSASSHDLKSKTAKRTGRHRAPSRVHRSVKIIGVAAPAVALVAAFVSYKAQPQPLNPVASSLASYHQRGLPSGGILADGSGTAMITPGSNQSGKTTAKPQSAKAPKPSSASPTPAPSAQSGSSAKSPASLQSSVQKDIANGNNLLAIAQYLVENGYSAAAAAGVASCVDGESGGNPESVGSGGGGLIGWTPLSSAAPNPNVITGNAAQDMMTQLADILYYDSTEIGQSLVAQLNSNTDPVAAADFFSENFEKPAVTNSDVVPSVAEQVFSELGS